MPDGGLHWNPETGRVTGFRYGFDGPMEWTGREWTLRETGAVTPAFSSSAWDSARNVLVATQGTGIQEWDGDAWTAFVVMYGGDPDVWEWDGTTWSSTRANLPWPRDNPGLGWDPIAQETVMVGGTSQIAGVPIGDPLGDSWGWNGSTWRQRIPTAPSAWARVVFDETSQSLLALLQDPAGNFFGATRAFDSMSWVTKCVTPSAWLAKQLYTSGPIPGYPNGVAVAVGQHLQMTVWDGRRWVEAHPSTTSSMTRGPICKGVNGGIVTVQNNQLRTWDGLSWTSSGPSTPTIKSMALDEARGTIVAITGANGDATAISRGGGGGSFTTVQPATQPSARRGALMVYDAARQVIVMFGGLPAAAGTETWEWDGTDWRQVITTRFPLYAGSRPIHATYDAARQRVVAPSLEPTGDILLEFDGVDWRPRPGSLPAGAPLNGRTQWFPEGFAYDPHRGSLVVYDWQNTWVTGLDDAASVSAYGTGCGNGSRPTPEIRAFGTPWVDSPGFAIDVASAPRRIGRSSGRM